MRLAPLTAENAETIRQWRNLDIAGLRTPYRLTREQQEDWYQSVVCDRRATARWFGLYDADEFVGYSGIEGIQWESAIGEISLLLGPEYQGRGLGEEALHITLYEAFSAMNLQTVYGECYLCNRATEWWARQVVKLGGYKTTLPNRKYWGGRYWDSLYFSFDRDTTMGGESDQYMRDSGSRWIEEITGKEHQAILGATYHHAPARSSAKERPLQTGDSLD